MECLTNYTDADLQLRDLGALSSTRQTCVDPGVKLVVSFIFFLMITSENFRTSRQNTWDTRKLKKKTGTTE